MKRIAYLHNHTNKSEQDGISKPKDYANRIKEMKQEGVEVVGFSVTEHGNLFSLVQSYKELSKETNFIPGIETYHCLDRSTLGENGLENKDKYHMVLLAKDKEGLKNLYQIASDAGTHKLKGRQKDFPRTHLPILEKHGRGIIALSACLGGVIPQYILNGKYEEAKELALKFNSMFDAFYLEVQPNEMEDQLLVNDALVRMSKETGLGLVITTDSHYVYERQRDYHDILKKISNQKTFDISCHMHSYQELEDYCNKYEIPLEAIDNTVKIAETCSCDPRQEDSKGLLPSFPCPKGYDDNSYLRKIVMDDFVKQVETKGFTDILERLQQLHYELEVICGKGFASYFLILWDWFKWCRENHIPIGKGRGSAAGSLASYVLKITTIDPISNGFFFERFLNMERLEYPDVDTDISKRDRPKAIQYLKDKYGEDHVCQIATFTEYNLKNTIKAVISAYSQEENSFAEANEITKAIPAFLDGKSPTYDMIENYYDDIKGGIIPENLNQNEQNSVVKSYEAMQEMFKKYPQAYGAITELKGTIASVGLHAGGVIISGKKLCENVAIMTGSDTAVAPVVQLEMGDCDFYSLLKIDALGLNTLTQVGDAMKLIGLKEDWFDSEDFSDHDVYVMIRKGQTTDIFQMSSYTATKMLKDMKVDSFEILGVVNAGNRPGPLAKNKETGLSMVDMFIERKATGIVPSIHPEIDKILEDTLGCIWYQEQCMQLGQVVAGYSLGMSDLRIRKILGKKLVDKIPEIRNEFIYGKQSLFNEKGKVIGISDKPSPYCEGAIARGYTEKIAADIFDAMAEFAKYSFNAAHSGAYAALAYKTAWLSYYYPVEWAISCLSSHEGNQEKMTATLSQVKRRGIEVNAPSVNKSFSDFTMEVDNDGVKAIRYGLLGIKDVGDSAIKYITDVREEYGEFKDFNDFYNTIHSAEFVEKYSTKINKKLVKSCPVGKRAEEGLIKAGAFDDFEPNRYKLMNYYLMKIKKIKDYEPLDEKIFARKHKLALEKEVMGSYISEHPLEPFPYQDLDEASHDEVVETTGLVLKTTIKTTKKGAKFANILVETKDGKERKIMAFGNVFEKHQDKFKKNNILVIKGKYNKEYSNINATSIRLVVAKKNVIREEGEETGVIDFSAQGEQVTTPVETFVPVVKEDPMDFFMPPLPI